MSYKELLADTIKNSNMSLREIADKCKEYNVTITPSYISQLQTGKLNPPTEEVSRAIANVCGVNVDNLIIEAYLDKLPGPIFEFIKNMASYTYSTSLNMFKDQLTPEIFEQLTKQIMNLPLSKFIIDSNSSFKNTDMSFENNTLVFSNSDDNSKLNINFNHPIGLQISDNGMAPYIPKGSTVTFSSQIDLDNNILIVFKYPNDNGVFIRKLFTVSDLYLLYPINEEFEPSIVKPSEISIFGKLKSVLIQY